MAKKNNNSNDDASLKAADKGRQESLLGGKPGGERGLPPSLARRKPVAFPNRLLNLLVIAMLGYGIYSYVQNGGVNNLIDAGQENVPEESAAAPKEPLVESLNKPKDYNFFSRMFPISRPVINYKILRQGSGIPALCGQNATYRLHAMNPDEPSSEPAQTVRIGGDKVKPGLTQGLVGMRPGEIRHIQIPPQLWKDNPHPEDNELTVMTVELLSLSPKAPEVAMPLRRFITKGGINSIRCGDPVIAHMKLWDSHGALLFDSAAENGAPIYFETGRGRLPFGIEAGAEDMALGGEYSLVIPPAMLTVFNPAQETAPVALPDSLHIRHFPSDLVLPSDRAVIVDMSLPTEAPLTHGEGGGTQSPAAAITSGITFTPAPEGLFPTIKPVLSDPVPEVEAAPPPSGKPE